MHDDTPSDNDLHQLLINQYNLLTRANELLTAVLTTAPAQQRGYIEDWLHDYQDLT